MASLVHDALYQLMREGKLAQDFRLPADRVLERIMLAAYRGGWPVWHAFRVRYWVRMLAWFGGPSAAPD